MIKRILFVISSLLLISSAGAQVPGRPTQADHPGSDVYSYAAKHETIRINGRSVEVFMPDAPGLRAPVVVYGHGQAMGVESYIETFNHLARKGVAVIFPQFDNGFFDQDWRRMAKDFNQLTRETIQKYSTQIDSAQISYSGHSKGAYIALMAAGAPDLDPSFTPRSLVLFAPAGYDAEYLARLDPNLPISLFWGDSDTIIKRESVMEIYNRAPNNFKQFIEVKSYQELSADHFFVANKSSFLGGRDGISAFHYFGAWKWMLGAVWDTSEAKGIKDPYIYGDQADTTGMDGLKHTVIRSWQNQGNI